MNPPYFRVGMPSAISGALLAGTVMTDGLNDQARATGIAYLNAYPPLPLGTLLMFGIIMTADEVNIAATVVKIALPLPAVVGPGPIVI